MSSNVVPLRADMESKGQERAVLAALLARPAAAIKHTAQLEPSDFVHPAERSVFEAISQSVKTGRPIERKPLAGMLQNLGLSLPGGGEEYLLELELEFVALESLSWYVTQVLDRSRARRLVDDLKNSQKLAADEIPVAAVAAIERFRARALQSDGFETLTVGEVPDPGPTRWLIDGLWIAGGVGFIAGEPKARKSFFTAAAAVAIASGRKLLQQFQTQQAPVVMFNAEDRISETASRLRRIAVAEGIDSRLPNVHLINITGMRLNSAADMAKLSATVRRIKPGIVFLDPFRNLFDGDEDRSEAVMAALSPLRILQREHNCSVAVVHHMTKPSETKRRAGQRMRGSGALHGWGDSNLYVELAADEDISVVEVEQRYAEACDPFAWSIRDQNTPDGPAAWCEPVAVPGKAKSEEVKNAGHASHEVLVLRTVEASKEPINAGHIAKALKMRRENVFTALASLNEKNLIDQVEREIVDKMGRTRPVTGWVKANTK